MIPVRLLDNQKLKDLGWTPKYDLESGLRDATFLGIRKIKTNLIQIQNLSKMSEPKFTPYLDVLTEVEIKYGR